MALGPLIPSAALAPFPRPDLRGGEGGGQGTKRTTNVQFDQIRHQYLWCDSDVWGMLGYFDSSFPGFGCSLRVSKTWAA